MGKRVEYELWFDESGRFDETVRGETARRRQRFPSQLAGLLVPRGKLTSDAAETVLRDAHRAADLALSEQVHGKDMADDAFRAVVAAILPALHARQWQPVRLVNHEGVSFGDSVSTYTQMVAELVLRVLRELSARGHEQVDLHVFPAVVKTGERDDDTPELIEQSEYLKRLREALGAVAMRRGVGNVAGWHVAGLQTASGRWRRELQICDLISHASHHSFKRLDPELRAALRQAFGPFDQTLVLDELLERVDDLANDAAYGRALALLAEASLDAERARRDGVRKRLGTLLDGLAAMGARGRDPELSTLLNLVEQVVERQRDVAGGQGLVSFLLREVEAPLRARLDAGGAAPTIDWFTYALHRWELTDANHAGALVAAKRAAAALDRLTPSLAGHWEHAPFLVDGMIARAVHRTDCFAYDEASSLMKAVASYYGDLSGLFHDALPAVFPERIRSKARGEALGTRLQAEMYAALRDPKRLDLARKLSDEALDELVAADDKARQRQYRCQLETIAGDFPTAREHLAASLGLDTATHAAIGDAIAAVADSTAQGFALLHWLRLGRAASMSSGAERDDFMAALKLSKVLALPWLTGGHVDYPVHGILRQAAGVYAIQGSMKDALGCLSLLRRSRSTLALDASTLAATVEVAGLLWANHRPEAQRLLESKDKERPGALQLLETIGHAAREGVPELWAVLAPWEGAIRGVLKGAVVRDPRDVLVGLGREVP